MGKAKNKCLVCKKVFVPRKERINTAKYCSHSCLWKMNIPPSRKGIPNSLEQNKKISFSMKRAWQVHDWSERKKNLLLVVRRGENHYRWNPNREEVKRNLRNDGEYKQWAKEVKHRDRSTCQLESDDCLGNIVVHHIKGWALYLDLRYEVSNGITLCQFHHPRKRIDEQRLIPVFEELVGSNV